MRFSILLLAMLVVAPAALAQPSFGVKAGLNTATVFFDDEDGFDAPGVTKEPRLGLVAGVTADIPFTPTLGLRLEGLYAQKGFAIDFDIEDEIFGEPVDAEGKQTLRLDYVEVPVLINVMIPMQNALEIGVQGGVVPAFKINESVGCSGFEQEVDGETIDGCVDFEEENDEPLGIKSFDLGAALGATIGSGPFAVDLRYTLGLTDLNEDDADNFSNNNRANNGVFSATFVYRLGR